MLVRRDNAIYPWRPLTADYLLLAQRAIHQSDEQFAGQESLKKHFFILFQ
jgi:hypothetical protein